VLTKEVIIRYHSIMTSFYVYMKKFFALFLLFTIVSVASAQTRTKILDEKLDAYFPAYPSNYLTDLAGAVKNANAVNARLKIIRDSSKLSLVAVVLPTTGDRDEADIAREIGRKWMVATANDTIGAAVRNTGGVILLVMDRHRCRVEVATGSEGYMTDARAAEACRAATDDFRAGNFGDGILSIANTFVTYHDGEMQSAPKPSPLPDRPFPWTAFWFFVACVTLVLVPVGYVRHKVNKENERLREIAEKKEAAARAEQERQYAIRRAEQERLAEIERKRLAAIEKARWDALTPEQQKAELVAKEAERVRLAAIAAAEAEAARERRAREDEEERNRRASQSSYDYGSSSSSSDSSSGWSSGGSDSFGGGGGGSSW
jgi:uncharacterized membrane protein YgcG